MLNRIRSNIFHTFRGRLATLYIVVELTILIIAGILIYFILSKQVYDEVDERLYEQAQGVVYELEHSSYRYWSFHLNEFSRHFHGSVQLVASNGIVQFASNSTLIGKGGNEISKALGSAMKGESTIFVSTRSLLRKDNIRVVAMPVYRAGHVVAVLLLGRSTSEIQGFFKWLYLLGGVLGLFSMLISGVVGYIMARRALKPINEITSTARAVAAGDLSRRLQSDVQDKEIYDLVTSLNKMFADLESSFMAQKRFTADASHELRIPLTILKGEVEVALRHPRSEEDYRHLLKQHLDIIERMQRIVNDLLTLARADAGLLELAQEPVDLSLLLQEVAQHHLILFAENHINLGMDVQDNLEVMGDGGHIERVIFNLLNNAFKYAPEHSTVSLSAHAENDTAVIRIKDEGPGISEAHQARLFDRFYRADEARARTEGGGAGLGLAICKRIVEAHKGEISVQSKVGEGAEFFVRLPLSSTNPAFSQRLNTVIEQKQ
ncbi:MAG: ATP-binding protein [Mariprofundaceae bacterium]|nr:ATP-binding protein [Mariprofundaceae bacterium]